MSLVNRYSAGFCRRILVIANQIVAEALMRIVISAAGMVRLAVSCFVLGVAIGVYFGVAGSPEAVPPTVGHSVDAVAPVNATAP